MMLGVVYLPIIIYYIFTKKFVIFWVILGHFITLHLVSKVLGQKHDLKFYCSNKLQVELNYYIFCCHRIIIHHALIIIMKQLSNSLITGPVRNRAWACEAC